ncbi:MAG: SRPBCC family protein, partial [SAR86 cluster bacterium]|nr:SRPBCC family protein [SAR86 cluster bacterium]
LDTYGPHQRLTFGRKSLKDLIGKSESEWDSPLENIRLIHSGFPNLSISGVLGDHCLVSQIFPTASPNRTITRQTILSAKEPKTSEEIANTNDFSEMVRQAVVDEDYKIGLEIQSNISHLGSNNFVYGKNEPAVQNYHSWIKDFMSKDGSDWK